MINMSSNFLWWWVKFNLGVEFSLRCPWKCPKMTLNFLFESKWLTFRIRLNIASRIFFLWAIVRDSAVFLTFFPLPDSPLSSNILQSMLFWGGRPIIACRWTILKIWMSTIALIWLPCLFETITPDCFIFRSYGAKSTPNTRLTEGVIPENIRTNPCYIRYMQTSGRSQPRPLRRGLGGAGEEALMGRLRTDINAIKDTSIREILLTLTIRRGSCSKFSLKAAIPRHHDTSCLFS